MTTPTQQVTVLTPGQAVLQNPGAITQREAQLYASAIGRGLEEQDMRVFAAICRHAQLDPFRKEIYAWREGNKLTVHIGIQGWRSIAKSGEEYGGQVGPLWCGPDGVWKDVWLEERPPAAARVGIRVKGEAEPTYATVTWREFERTKARMGARSNTIWDDKPSHMLAIRAEAHALQKACPGAFKVFQNAVGHLTKGMDVQVEAVSEEEIPQLPAGLNTETGELEDVTPSETVDSPESKAEGESAREQSDRSSDADAPSPEAQQPGLMDAATPRAFSDDDWHKLGEDMASKQPPVVAQDVAKVLGKPFNAANVAEWMQQNDAPWGQLVDMARVRRAQASERG